MIKSVENCTKCIWSAHRRRCIDGDCRSCPMNYCNNHGEDTPAHCKCNLIEYGDECIHYVAPNLFVIADVAKVLGVSLDYFVYGEE